MPKRFVEEGQVHVLPAAGGRRRLPCCENRAEFPGSLPFLAVLRELLAQQVVCAIEDGEDARVAERLCGDVGRRAASVALATDNLLVVMRGIDHVLGGDRLERLGHGEAFRMSAMTSSRVRR